MKKSFKTYFSVFFILLFFLFFSQNTFAQAQNQSEGKTPTGKVSRAIARSKKRAEHKEARDKRKMEKATKKSIEDHHKRLQTKDTRKRMKTNRKKAGKNNRRQNL
jgi:hypothetical protein